MEISYCLTDAPPLPQMGHGEGHLLYLLDPRRRRWFLADNPYSEKKRIKMGTYQESEKQFGESKLTLGKPVCRHCSVRTATMLCPSQSQESQQNSTIVIPISLVRERNDI